MAGFTRLSRILEEYNGVLFFECPGCNRLHGVNVSREEQPKWSWNGDVNRPTFSPSILVEGIYGEDRTVEICHSFVRDGVIEFLNDCTHDKAGSKAEIPDLED